MAKLEKPVKHGVYRPIHTVALKPVDAVRRKDDPTKFNYFARYVDRTHNERKIPCSPEFFLKVAGKRRKRAPHTGLDMMTNTGFVIHVRVGDNELAELIDIYPNKVYSHRIYPADDAEKTKVIMDIDEKGQITVVDVPYRIRAQRLQNLMAEIDKVAAIDVGDEIGNFSVTDVAGRRVTLEYTGEDDSAAEPHPDYMGM